MTDLIEYKVRKVTRFIVTRFHNLDEGRLGSVDTCGEYENEDQAYTVGEALAFREREKLGWPPGDERMQFPQKMAEG